MFKLARSTAGGSSLLRTAAVDQTEQIIGRTMKASPDIDLDHAVLSAFDLRQKAHFILYFGFRC